MANAWTRGAGASVSAAEREPGAPLEVTAGLGKDAGQKVVNQLAALERLKPDDAIVTFIDADALPTPLWLARLVAVLINSGKPLATGYRWMTPPTIAGAPHVSPRGEQLDRVAPALRAAADHR